MSTLQLTAVALFVGAQSVWSMSALAQAAERLADRDVKKIVDQVDEARDKFENNLDGNFKNSNVRGPNGEVKVSNLLQDWQLTQLAARVQAFVDLHRISAANWERVRTSLATVRMAFGLAQ